MRRRRLRSHIVDELEKDAAGVYVCMTCEHSLLDHTWVSVNKNRFYTSAACSWSTKDEALQNGGGIVQIVMVCECKQYKASTP